ncbi:MAG: amidohydrolase family protein [Bacteroidales bacterium]
MKRLIFILTILWFPYSLFSQTTPTIGVSDKRPGKYAFTNAVIYVDYQTKIENATLLIDKDEIKAAGQDIEIPEGYQVKDLQGKYIYPSFIDPYSSYGIPDNKDKEEDNSSSSRRNQRANFKRSEDHPVNWNEAIRPHYNAVEDFTIDKEKAKELREMGFGTVTTFMPDGIARGTSVLATLTDESENKAVINKRASAHYSFDKGSSSQNYPSSLMGSIALLRQTYYDARWYKENKKKPFSDITLEAWSLNQSLPQVFEVENKRELMRANKIGREFNVNYIIKGAGDEYQIADQIKNTGISLILPVTFPEPPTVENAYQADEIELKDLRHWELAPANFKELNAREIPFAITSHGVKNKNTFFQNLKKSINHGFDKTAALKALTWTPAHLMDAQNKTGSLEEGKLANFIVTSGDIFDTSSKIYENWVQGKCFAINKIDPSDHTGTYNLNLDDQTYTLKITGKPSKEEFSVVRDDTMELKANGEIDKATLYLNIKDSDSENKIRLSGWAENNKWKGTGYTPDGEEITWNAQLTERMSEQTEDKKEKESKPEIISNKTSPFVAYGYESKPQQKTYLIKNATVWTNEEEGIVENYDVLVRQGKIEEVGRNIQSSDAEIIDGADKHLTSGVIDEHSHIAIEGGTNEASHAVTSEVRIEDILNPDDINIYRQLSGGVTMAQLLHGSANPVGGQSAIIKHRWGAKADELLVDNATPFLKHALGENVKQSRHPYSSRYPQTRMGVEAIIKDAYLQAEEYKEKWDNYQKLSNREKTKTQKPRKDLRLEAIADVLREESFITCHSYVQSETNMILKLAEEFGIKAHTLIHNTAGYKIADRLKEHGAYASNLPDWWAYKFEVYDAIPYNSALQDQQGILTAIHSDNAELARRLNQEAAKTVKYGGLSEEEAWKLVTLNPAKILHLDHKTGSIREGKDADLVLWSNNPLSIYATAEKTMVDGIIYYDREEDEQIKKEIEEERNMLINKILNKSKKEQD